MTDSETKFKEIEKIYSEVVDKLDATTRLFNDFKGTVDSEGFTFTPKSSQTAAPASHTVSSQPSQALPAGASHISPAQLNHMTPQQISHMTSVQQSHMPSLQPSHMPSVQPTHMLSVQPTHMNSIQPTHMVSVQPNHTHSAHPSHVTSSQPNQLNTQGSHMTVLQPGQLPSAQPSQYAVPPPSHMTTEVPAHMTGAQQTFMVPSQVTTNSYNIAADATHTQGVSYPSSIVPNQHLQSQISQYGTLISVAPLSCSPHNLSQSYCQTCPRECVSAQASFQCPPDPCLEKTTNELIAQKVDLGAMEVLMLLTDGYIQQCEGNPQQEENKCKLMKLRKRLIMNRNFKPKTITKFIDYVQKIGVQVMQLGLEQHNYSTLPLPPDHEELKADASEYTRVSKASVIKTQREACKTSKLKEASKPCLVNGMQAVSLGKVIPIGKLSECAPVQGPCGQDNNRGANDQNSGNATQYYNYACKYTPAQEKSVSFHQVAYPIPQQYSQSLTNRPSCTSYEAPQPSDQPISTPSSSAHSSPYEQFQSYTSLESAFVEQQRLPAQASQNGPPIPPPTTQNNQDASLRVSHFRQEALSPMPSVMLQPNQSHLTPQVSAAHQLSNQPSRASHISVTQPSQQILHPQVSQLRQDASRISARAQPSQQPSKILSERVLSNYDKNSDPQDVIGQVQSQGTQYHDTEILVPPSKLTSSSQEKSLTKMTSKHSLSRKESCEEEDRPETMIEKLERKSLNIPEGTLVTDGTNVYYITRPNVDGSDKGSSEEVIVNIPIKGSNIVKPSGEAKPRKNGSACCKCPSDKKGKSKSKQRLSKGMALDKLLLKVDSDGSLEEEEDGNEEQTEKKKKPAYVATVSLIKRSRCPK